MFAIFWESLLCRYFLPLSFQGESNVEYFLGLTPTGIVVYKHKSKVASYFW